MEAQLKNPEKAVKIFNNNLNCCQSIIAAYAPEFNLDDETALKLATGFGGGLAGKGEICGAVSGAYMVIGLKYGRSNPKDVSAKELTIQKIKQFDRMFIEKHGHLHCNDLLGFDRTTEEGSKKIDELNLHDTLCPKLVKQAAEILDKVL